MTLERIKLDFPISSKISLNALSGDRHKVRYCFTKGSHALDDGGFIWA